VQSRLERSRLFMLDADPVGRYRAEDVSPTDGVVAGIAGKVAGGAVAGTPGMDADPVGRDRADAAHRTDLEGDDELSSTSEH
jgi:hypothetical protein